MQLLQKYKIKFDNENLFSETNGRPTLVSPEDEAKLKEFICDGYFNKTTLECDSKIEELMISTAASQNLGACTIKPMCRRIKKRLETKLHVMTADVDNGTAAREESCGSLRNIVSMAAMNDGISNGFNECSYLVLNINGTQYTVDTDSKSTEIKYIEIVDTKSLKAAPRSGERDIVSFFIKFYLLISAGGLSADPVNVIQDGNMKDGDIDVHRVEGLGMTNNIGTYGYVVYCKTR